MTRPKISREQQAAARVRASHSAGRANPPARYQIEGETLTAAEIGVRLGNTKNTAEAKLRAARKMPGPVTWERLRGVSS